MTLKLELELKGLSKLRWSTLRNKTNPEREISTSTSTGANTERITIIGEGNPSDIYSELTSKGYSIYKSKITRTN